MQLVLFFLQDHTTVLLGVYMNLEVSSLREELSTEDVGLMRRVKRVDHLQVYTCIIIMQRSMVSLQLNTKWHTLLLVAQCLVHLISGQISE